MQNLGESRRGNAGKGRIKGSKNKIQHDISALAREYGPLCIAVLAEITVTGEPADQARAVKTLLDRGYGQAPQAISLTASGNINISLVNYSGKATGRPELILPRHGASNGGALQHDEAATNGSGHPPPE